MRWEDEEASSNVQDDRGQSSGFGGGGFGGFGGGGMGPIAIGGGGLGAVVLVVLGLLFGVDPSRLLGGGSSAGAGAGGAPPGYQQGVEPGSPPPSAEGPRADDQDAAFASRVLKMTEQTWGEVFSERGARYAPPTLVLYDDQHPTGCGGGEAAMGPFYCPADQKVYLDLSFFRELSGRFGAPGRFAEAYVIAHEVGHHVQNLLGVSDKVDQARQNAGSRAEANQLSVRVELQADCYAGVWAERTNRDRHFLDAGDVDQGLAAASAVGDDTLQKQTRGRVVPDAFTHGSSAQRMRWFKTGFERGDLTACNTFAGSYAGL